MSPSLLASLCLVLAAPAEDADTHKAAVAFVTRLQNQDGGFRPMLQEGPSSLRSTLAAVRVIKISGGTLPEKPAIIQFVASCFDASKGAFADTPRGKSDTLATAIGLMVLIDLEAPLQPYADPGVRYLDSNSRTFEEVRLAAAAFQALKRKPPHADAWVDLVKKMRKSDGTYGTGPGQARETGSAVVTLLRLGQPMEQREAVLDVLNAGQREGGGFGKADSDKGDLESTYRVLRAYHMLKAKPTKEDELKNLLNRCRNTDGGFGVAPGDVSTASGTYYATIVVHWLEEKN